MLQELFSPGILALRADRMVDVEAGTILEDRTILVENDTIVGVQKKAAPSKFVSLDLGDATLLPGLHDNHCHLMLKPEDLDAVVYKRSSAAKTLDALVHAHRTVFNGFTTIRDPGDCDWQNGLVDLRTQIDTGHIPGPRMLIAPHYLSITGGHGDANDYACDLCMRGIGKIVDGVDAMRRAVREEIKLGADWIKLFAGGGVLSRGDSPEHSHYTFDEVRVAGEEAHRLGVKITAHAHGAEAVKFCAEAGFDSVEHCTMIDDDGLALMKRKGTYCVPTLYCLDYLQIPENPMHLDASIVEKAKTMRGYQRDRFAKVVQAGVPVAYGTDIGIFPHGENWKDFPCMIECGMSTEEALRSATINSARMNGIDDTVGLLQAGYKADVIAVRGNPLTDINAVSQVCFVMQGGAVYRHEVVD